MRRQEDFGRDRVWRSSAARSIRHVGCGLVGTVMSLQAGATPGVTVVSPANGAVVAPGSAVRVEVQVDPALNPTEVHVWPSGRSRVRNLNITAPPYEGYLQIPADSAGSIEVDVWVESSNPANDHVAGEAEFTLNVVLGGGPLQLAAPANVSLEYQSSIEGEDTEQLFVDGIYADGIKRNLSSAALGTTYVSTNPSVATVDANGKVQAQGAGFAFITIENAGIRTYTGVKVQSPGRVEPAVMDVTSQVQIGKSGFRHDPGTDEYVQEVTFRNVAQLPLQIPLEAVLSGLPTDVVLKEAEGVTRTVVPLGSPYVRVDPPSSGAYLAPGQLARAILRFSNPNAAAITYTLKLYTGLAL